jgi:hypothetical protein
MKRVTAIGAGRGRSQPRNFKAMLVPPLKRERTESSRGRLNIRVAITEFYCDRTGRFAGLFVAGSKSESPAKAGPSVDGLVRLWGDLKHASCGAPKGSAQKSGGTLAPR